MPKDIVKGGYTIADIAIEVMEEEGLGRIDKGCKAMDEISRRCGKPIDYIFTKLRDSSQFKRAGHIGYEDAKGSIRWNLVLEPV